MLLTRVLPAVILFVLYHGSQVTSVSKGTVFTRWGHSECPELSKPVYNGIMAGKYYTNTGSGGNFLCLPFTPIYDETVLVEGLQNERGRLYHQEYRSTTGPFATQKDNDLPCVVCLDGLHSSTILHLGRNDCPTGFHLQYHGYLVGAQYTSHAYDSIETTCVDHEGRTVPFTSAAVDGGYLMPVDGTCISGTALPCTHYIDGFELTCAMCSV